MRKLLFLYFFICSLNAAAQNPREYWQWIKSIGGAGDDIAADYKLQDGFLYITGTFTSPTLVWDNTTLNNTGGRDIFVAKVDTNGNTVWVKNFGGTDNDSVSVLEINAANHFVLLCKSASQSINLASGLLTAPKNFYTTFDENGNVLLAQVLPDSLDYTDIEIDDNGGVYAACKYARAFIFAGKTVSQDAPPTPPIGAPVSYPFGGTQYYYMTSAWPPAYRQSAALLKYDASGTESWMKLFHSYPEDLQIAFDNTNIIAMFVHRGATDYDSTFFTDKYFTGSPGFGSFPGDNLTAVISKNGVTQRVINDQDYTSKIYDLHFAANGLGYGASSYYINVYGSSNNDYDGANLKEFKNSTMSRNILTACSGNVMTPPYYQCQKDVPYNIQTAQISKNALLLINEEKGIYHNPPVVYIVDSNFTRLDSLHVPNADSISLASKTMDDSAVYFMHNFSSSNINIDNNQYPGLPSIYLSSAGNKDIFLGRYHRRGYMPLAFTNFDSTIKFCSGINMVNLHDADVLYYRGTGSPRFHWEPASFFQNPDTLVTGVTIVDTLTARLIVTDGADTIIRKVVFRKGIESDMQLHLSDSVACGNAVISASLTGSIFDTCMATSLCDGQSWWFYSLPQVNEIQMYNSRRVPACDSARVFRLDIPEQSNYCSSTSTVTVRVKPYNRISIDSVFVCPGSSYTFPGDTTYTNITQDFYRSKTFVNRFGCDSFVNTHIMVLPYARGEIAYVCEGGSYTFPNGVTLNNIAYQPSNIYPSGEPYIQRRTISSASGCDSIVIFTSLYVKRTNSKTNTVNLCPGSDYTFTDGTVFLNIQADTSHTIHFTNMAGCDSAVTTAIHIGGSHRDINVHVCNGGTCVFPDGTSITNIVRDTTYTSHLISVGGCDSSITTNITVLPVFYYTQYDSVCSGNAYVFPGGTTINNIIRDTSYTSHLVSVDGCDSTITTNITVLPVFYFTQYDSVCRGGSYVFPGNVQQNNITADIIYTSHLVTHAGCDSIIVTNISVISNDTSVTKSRSTLTANLDNAQYQWIDCNNNTVIPAETNQTYTATQVGSYAVTLTKDGCTDTSSCYDIALEDLRSYTGDGNFVISPNPVSDILRIQYLSSSASAVQIEISDLFGNRITRTDELVITGLNQFEVNTSSLSGGIYFCVLYNSAENKRIVKRFVKN